NTKRLLSEGVFKKMRSSVPEVSSVAWSSIITGCNPAEHGIFGFMDFAPGTYRLQFPNYNNLKRQPFWAQPERKSAIINIPSTFPVRELDGVHISGFVSLDLERSVHPKSLINKLKEIDYRLDVDSEKAHKSFEFFLNDLDRTLKARIEAYRYLWNKDDWKNFVLVFTGTDRLMHFLWDAYEDKAHKYHARFLEHFRQIDEVIGEIADALGAADELIMCSDHGFERLDKEVNINYILKINGFLNLPNSADSSWGHIDGTTRAFALDPARIYINLKGKYPRGSVAGHDREGVLGELERLFGSLESDGKKVIRDVYRKEDIYSGPLMDRAPDLVLVGNKGFNLRANIKAENMFSKGIFSGKHTQDDAFLFVKGISNNNIIPEDPEIFDIVKILQGDQYA
ncbi:alkaline phosphatase family protein, partial [Candidatus Omnitrophota bacterium]